MNNAIQTMKRIWFFVGFALCANLNANAAAFDKPAIDTQAPAYFAHLIDRSDYVVIPRHDPTRRTMTEPVIIRERVQLDEIAGIFKHAVYEPTSHILAATTGDPITFYAADKQRVLTFERFGNFLRLNGADYKTDKRTLAALTQWFKKVQDNRSPETEN